MSYWDYDLAKMRYMSLPGAGKQVTKREKLIDEAKEVIKEAEDIISKEDVDWDGFWEGDERAKKDAIDYIKKKAWKPSELCQNGNLGLTDDEKKEIDKSLYHIDYPDKMWDYDDKRKKAIGEKASVVDYFDVWQDYHERYRNLYPTGNLSGLNYHPDTKKAKEEKERVSPGCYKTETYSVKIDDNDWKAVIKYLEDERDRYKKLMFEESKKHSDLHMARLDESRKYKKLEEENKRLKKIVDLMENDPEEYKRRKELDPFNEEKWEDD
jgi:hypothetical protein